MKRYKVVAFGGHDGLAFEELLVKFSGGFLLPLKVKQGQYIPTQILDPLDVEKSLLVGSLGKYLRGGQVIEEDDEPKATVQETPKNVTPDPTPKAAAQPAPAPVVVPEPAKPAETPAAPVKPEVSQPESMLTNLSEVKSEADFFRLGFFLKVKYIENCNDKALLQYLLTKTTGSHQLQVNIQQRLATMK